MQRIGESKLMAAGNNPQAGNFQSTQFYGWSHASSRTRSWS
jgi:hypothetical protein